MWWMYSRALSMPNKMYAMVSSLIPSEKCVQIRSLADPERPSIIMKRKLSSISTGYLKIMITVYTYYVQ